MIRLRPSGVDEILIKRVQDWYEPGPGVFIQSLTASFSPAMLFTGSTTGAWYDPSDTTTLYRDAAGTQPVTAVEQPVGLMLDKSGRGNHAFNGSGNSANFPVLSARYNLLTKTEDFSDAVWTKSNILPFGSGSVTNTTETLDPIGGNSADKIVATTSTALTAVDQYYNNKVAGNHTYSFYIKAAGVDRIQLFWNAGFSSQYANFNLTSVSVTAGTYTDATILDIGNGWRRCTITSSIAAVNQRVYVGLIGTDNSARAASFTGDDISGIYLWGADLRVANDGVNLPAYQRVNTSTDYDTVGFKPYLRFNGTNQWLQTNSIDFSYGDKMFVSAGVRKLSDAAVGSVLEFSTSSAINPGTIQLRAPANNSVADYMYASNGSTLRQTIGTGFASPITNVVSGIGDISGDQAILRVNGAQAAINVNDQGTGNYGNYPLYIGARAGSSLWFNGRLYGMVVAGKQASAAEITSTETYLNQKTGAF